MAPNPAPGKAGQKAERKGGGGSDALLRAPPLPKTVPNADLMATIDQFLAAAVAYSGQATGTRQAFVHAALSSSRHDRQACGMLRSCTQAAWVASRRSVEAAVQVARKNVLPLDPSLQRLVCTQCSALLLPGVAATIRTRPSGPHTRLVQVRCHVCNHVRRWPAPPLPSQVDSEAVEPTLVEPPAPRRSARLAPAVSITEGDSPQDPTSTGAEADKRSCDAPPLPKRKRRISQRQRRRNGKMVRLAADALEGKGARTRLVGLHAQPDILHRAQQLAHKHAALLSQPSQAADRPHHSPSPSPTSCAPAQPSVSHFDLLRAYATASLTFPTRKERLAMRQLERAVRTRVPKPIDPARPTKYIPLPPFHERVQGSHWADHLARATLLAAATAQGHTAPLPPEQEEAAARALRGGGHVV